MPVRAVPEVPPLARMAPLGMPGAAGAELMLPVGMPAAVECWFMLPLGMVPLAGVSELDRVAPRSISPRGMTPRRRCRDMSDMGLLEAFELFPLVCMFMLRFR